MKTVTLEKPQGREAPASWTTLLEQAISEPGRLAEAFNAFHDYSIYNQMLAVAQCSLREISPGPIATYNKWKERKRCVRKGERAIILCYPRTYKIADAEDPEDRQFGVTFHYGAFWFVLAQTDGEPYDPPPTPGWDADLAMATLKLTLVPFDMTDGNVLGYSRDHTIAISPLADHPLETQIHEMGHAVLHQTCDWMEKASVSKRWREVEAEAVALIVCSVLGVEDLSEQRGYIQHWLSAMQGDPVITEATVKRIFSASDTILKAGQAQAKGDDADGR